MTIASELVLLAHKTAQRLVLPRIRRVFVPPPQPDPPRDAEFGIITLDDGSTGFFYAWLGRTQDELQRRPAIDQIGGLSALDLAERFDGGDDVDAALGIGAISAIYQHLLKRNAYQPDTTTNSMARLRFREGDHVGMVGFFPPLVNKLRAANIPLTVIEKKTELLNNPDGVDVTLETSRLRDCNKVLCTAATLLNHSLDEVLGYCPASSIVAVIGPTAGCFPDPLFCRGVDVIGGSQVVHAENLVKRLERGEPWGDAVNKYTLVADRYPGNEALLANVSQATPES